MNHLNAVARDWLEWILAASWQLALLAALVGLACYVARRASPRLRYALWLLIVLKVFLPPALSTPWGIGSWALAPMAERTGLAAIHWPTPVATDNQEHDDEPTTAGTTPAGDSGRLSPAVAAMLAWAAGCLVFWAVVVARYARVERLSRAARAIDEGPLCVQLEQTALGLKLRRTPELLATHEVVSPFLFGVARPRIVLPETLLEKLSAAELAAVLTHELVHWRRGDTWVGWLQVAAQSLFWFHPFVWWANRQLRDERECVCDELVLRMGSIEPRRYGQSILSVLAESRARTLAAGSLVGVFEPGATLQKRMEEIMNYELTRQGFGWAARAGLAAFALVFVPMGFASVSEQALAADARGKGAPPRIVKTSPERGASDVNPATTEISVTFDRDMGRGMSWTGGGPEFPKVVEDAKPKWTNPRTCVLPVKLVEGTYYRVGINSSSYKNFQSSDGVPVEAAVIYFVTSGAEAAIKARLRAPKIVSLSPAKGARDVDPATTELVATFDMPMGDGMSWTGGGPKFPKPGADGAKAGWSADQTQCTLPVVLEPGHDYELGLNNPTFNNFQSEWGVPMEPVVYKFHTRGKAGK